MTDTTEITLEERITQYLSVGGLWNPEAMEHDKVRTLLMDCREYLQRIQKAERPEPPQWFDVPMAPRGVKACWKEDYDALSAYADRMAEQCNRLTGMKFSERMHAALVSRAESAEAKLARVVEGLREPVAWMVYTQDGKDCYITSNPKEISENQRALPLFTGVNLDEA